MHRPIVIGLAVVCLLIGEANAQYPYNRGGDGGAGVIGGILGGILHSMPTQQPVQPGDAAQSPQAGHLAQPVAQPDPRAQQQIETEHQRAAADAEAKVRQRQQAETDARVRHHQAELKADADAKAKADAEQRKDREIANKLRVDPALLALLGSDQRDISVLIVAKDTQTIVRNLKGDPIFQSAPTACLPFGGLATQPGSPAMRFLANVTADIEQRGGLVTNGTSLIATACDPADLDRYDLVIFSAGQVAGGATEILSPLVDALRNRQFVSFGTFTVAEFDAREHAKIATTQAEEARKAAAREVVRSAFQSRDPATISAIYTESPAAVVCLAASEAEGVRYLLKRNGSPLAGLVTETSVLREVPSADAIFIAMKKHDCGAAIAPAGMLKDVVAGLTRDGVNVDVHPGTIDHDQLAQWKTLAAKGLLAAQ
jgi:hypothetical protein